MNEAAIETDQENRKNKERLLFLATHPREMKTNLTI